MTVLDETGVAKRLAALEAHIARQDAEIAQLKRERATRPTGNRARRGRPAPAGAPTVDGGVELAALRVGAQTRRNLLKGGAIAAGAAAVAPLLSTQSAAAANGDAVTVGQFRESADGFGTSLGVRGGAGTKPFAAGFAVSDFTLGFAESPAAVLAVATGTHLWNGVSGFANARRVGESLPTSGHAVIATVGSAGRSNLWCVPNGLSPQLDGYAHGAGEIRASEDGDLWYCVSGGSPGVWRKLAGPATAGSAHIINPTRVYDSRNAGSGGSLATGASRVVSVANGISLSGGGVTVPDLVPLGATAVAFNLTVFFTAGNAGFLAVQAGDATTFTASTINWFGPNQLLANGSISTLDANRQLKVFSGGQAGNATGFLIDITGYFL